MLDVGCSYGMGSAFVKYGCSFDEMVAFYSSRAPEEYGPACEATRSWLNVTPPACDVRVVGVDSSGPAIRFGVDAGLLDGGIARNFEEAGEGPDDEEVAWFRSCNLLISTGAIGYITERTLDVVLRDLGRDHPTDSGPFAIVTILRMFEVEPIKDVFEGHGLTFAAVPGVRLPQRKFASSEERLKVLTLLHEHGIETKEWEDGGKQYADLYVAAPASQLPVLLECMEGAREDQEGGSEAVAYIRR
jgi:carnitine O-acetyltransferase